MFLDKRQRLLNGRQQGPPDNIIIYNGRFRLETTDADGEVRRPEQQCSAAMVIFPSRINFNLTKLVCGSSARVTLPLLFTRLKNRCISSVSRSARETLFFLNPGLGHKLGISGNLNNAAAYTTLQSLKIAFCPPKSAL